MARTLSDILKAQAEFDLRHKGKVPFFEEVSGGNIAALEHLLVCLMGEVGELANVVKKIRRGDDLYAEKKEEIIEETVDIFIYVLKLANQIGFDLDGMYSNKMELNRSRFRDFEA